MKRIFGIAVLLAVILPVYGQIYNNLMEAGRYAFADKNYSLSRYFYEEALKEIPADSIVELYITHSKLRDINKSLSEYEDALRHGHRCIEIMQGFGESSKYSLMEDYLLTADIYASMNDSIKACEYLNLALTTVTDPNTNLAYKKKFSTMTGIIFSHVGNHENAESAFELSAMISRRYQPSDDSVTTLNLYGNSLYQNNKYEEALNVYQEQRDVSLNLYGEDSRQYHWANYCIANILAFMGKIEEGTKIYTDVIGWYRNRILNDLPSMPSEQRRVYLDNMIDIIQNAIPFGVEAQYNDDEFTTIAYNGLLLTKGLLLATEQSGDAIIQNIGSQEERENLKKLKSMRTQLADMRANPNSKPTEILNLYAKIKTLDFDLANACSKHGNNTEFGSIGYGDVKNNLKDDEVILDFADFKPKSKPRQYVCYEIRKNQEYPKVHYVCNGDEIDSLLNLENGIWSKLYDGETGDAIAKIAGNPLKNIIGNSTTAYYVPSGIFHKLAIEAIPEGEKTIGDTYTLRRLSSAREVIKSSTLPSDCSAILYGGLNYDTAEMTDNPKVSVHGEKRLKNLPHSLQEVKEISVMFKEPALLIGDEGTEESFAEISGNSPSIIHVSTHGYYYSPDDKNRPVSLQGYNDAMSLSGLVMSGGNAGWTGIVPSKGLLSAEEVAGLDLSGTSLVSLASCHSGQGEVTPEGIYGLQRAFKKAGANTIILNLWEASDVATRYFMTSFYNDLVNGSKDRHKAFNYAKVKVREKYESPFYWAGFVMVD